MKRIFFLIFPFLCFACGGNKPDYDKIAQNVVRTHLTKIKNYEPVKTEVDSVFASVLFDSTSMKTLQSMFELRSNLDYIRRLYNERMESVMYGDSVPYYERLRRIRDVEDLYNFSFDTLNNKKAEFQLLYDKLSNDLKSDYDNYDFNRFYGYRYHHVYHCTDDFGTVQQDTISFITDEKGNLVWNLALPERVYNYVLKQRSDFFDKVKMEWLNKKVIQSLG